MEEKKDGRERREHIHTCRKCGSKYDADLYDLSHFLSRDMQSKGLCFHCAYWKWFFENHQVEILNGEIFTYGERLFTVDSHLLPINTRYIVHPDNSVSFIKMARSHGMIPEDQKAKHPDTGRRINHRAYRRLQGSRTFSCNAIGCYDRYHCYWYHPEEREKDGPWNIVPEDWEVGGEGCEGFIDKDIMYHI